MIVQVIVAEADCCCGTSAHAGPVEIVGIFTDNEKAHARAADLVLAAGKRGATLSVRDFEVSA